MWGAIVVATTFGVIAAAVALLWASTSTRPSRAVALLDPDVRGLARHEQARVEIQTIERVTRQLMRAAAASGDCPQPSVARVQQTIGVTPTFFGELATGPGFAWSPDSVASSSSSAGTVTFFTSNPWRKS